MLSPNKITAEQYEIEFVVRFPQGGYLELGLGYDIRVLTLIENKVRLRHDILRC